MAATPVHYFNRYTGRTETEQIYGEKYLRWVYGNPLGRLCLQALVKRALFSRWYGWRMNRPASRRKIRPFIDRYRLDPAEFLDPPDSFRTFNEFFHRKLRPESRPIAPGQAVAVFPADGRHLGVQDLSTTSGLFVKGQIFSLRNLLQDADLAARFQHGALLLSRLCPLDYHRFHFPVHGLPHPPQLLPGPLFSVNPIALRQNIHILSTNKRALGRIDSPTFGLVLMLEIGATNVGSFQYTFKPGRPTPQGTEKGYFQFGASSIITLFEKDRIRLAPDLLAHSAQGVELYAHVGDSLGHTPAA